MHLFVVVGMPAAGKNIARLYAESKGIPYFASGDAVRAEVKRRGLTPHAENMAAVSTALRGEDGLGVTRQVLAAALASGLDGIRNSIEPPALFEGDMYSASSLPRVPATLRDAIAALEKSSFAREAFGREVIEHYLHFYKTELRCYDQAVTDWERSRYFEQI